MLIEEIISVDSENRTKHTVCGQSEELLVGEAGGP
jgi:hypothetical protein